MFKIVKPDSLLWPVTIDVPRTDGSGETDPHLIKVRYKYLGVKEWQDIINGEGGDNDDRKVRDYVVGWADISNDDGEIEFSQSNLDMLMDIPYMAIGINKGFFECQNGSRSKN